MFLPNQFREGHVLYSDSEGPKKEVRCTSTVARVIVTLRFYQKQMLGFRFINISGQLLLAGVVAVADQAK